VAAPDPTKARFPDVPVAAGHYESWYLKACDPAERLGVWIRYTVRKRPGEAATGALWFMLFDGSGGGPRASKLTGAAPVAGDGGGWIRVGEARLGPGFASGAAPSERCDAAWELRFSTPEPPLFHLPRPALYTAPLPRTKLLTVAPGARFEGRLAVDGRDVPVDGWRGLVGHNWGAAHAERWVWLHGLGFDGADDAPWLDAAVARVALGPVATPWIATGAVSVDGVRHRLAGAGGRVRVDARPDGCSFVLPGRDATALGEVSAGRGDMVAWLYACPDGREHDALNCSIADMTLTVERRGFPPRVLRLAGGAAYELGGPERDHGVAVQPFADD
jgi:hypothetical protein